MPETYRTSATERRTRNSNEASWRESAQSVCDSKQRIAWSR